MPGGEGSNRPSILAHISEEAFKHLGLGELEGNKAYHKYVSAIANGAIGAVYRYNALVVIKYGFPIAPTYTVTCYKIATPGIAPAIYAYAYWRRGATEPEYMCAGPTYKSQDGEYRKSLIYYPNFAHTYASANEHPVFSQVESWVLGQIEQGGLQIDVTVYPDTEAELAGASNELRIGIMLLTYQTIRMNMSNTPATHVNQALDNNISSALGESGKAMLAGIQGDKELVGHIKTLLTGIAERITVVGQKFIPTTVMDIVYQGNVRYQPWREIWLSERATDLVVNSRCEHMPIFNQWALVRGADQHLYDNEAMSVRYQISDAARATLAHLRTARRVAAASDAHPRMKTLDREIYKSAAYAEQNIILSDAALMLTSESTGHTLDTFMVYHDHPKYHPDAKRTDDLWRKIVFDVIYGAYVLHSVCCHTDLHRQNITISGKFANEGSILYVLSPRGQRDTYVVPNTKLTSKLIDFSRGVINPAAHDTIAAEQGVEQATALLREQAAGVVAGVERWMPGYAREHQEAIKGAAYSHPARAYEALCCVDYLAASRCLNVPGAPVSAAVLSACKRVERAAQHELMMRLKQLTSGGDVTPSKEAGIALLGLLAPDWQYDAGDNASRPFIDAYYADAPMTFTATDPDRYPDWTKPDVLLRHMPGKRLDDILARDPDVLYSSVRDHAAGDEDLAIEAERARATLSAGAHPDAEGSWLN